MAKAKIIGISSLVLLLGSLLFYGGATFYSENAYFCQERNLVSNCDKLSADLTQCLVDGKETLVCSGTWEKIVDDLQVKEINQIQKQYVCNTKGCVPV